jgi:hypothetical protein
MVAKPTQCGACVARILGFSTFRVLMSLWAWPVPARAVAPEIPRSRALSNL